MFGKSKNKKTKNRKTKNQKIKKTKKIGKTLAVIGWQLYKAKRRV